MKPLILFHKSCMDGAGAALAAWVRYGDDAEYRAVQYGDPAPTDDEVRGRDVYVLDFSYPRAELQRMHAISGDWRPHFRVIDHHKTAQADLAGLPFCTFDTEKSGAVLAWEHFHERQAPTAAVPQLLRYIEDRDLWRWNLPQSREVSAALAARGGASDFRKLIDLLYMTPEQQIMLAQEGEAILRYQRQIVDSICHHAREIEIDGHKVLSANAPILQSEVGEQLAQGRPFGVAWFINDAGKRVMSLRSRAPTGIDVSAIAKAHGGGGHAQAAGFTEDVGAPVAPSTPVPPDISLSGRHQSGGAGDRVAGEPIDDVPTGVGDSGKEPFPSDARCISLTMPTRMDVVSFKCTDREGYASEVHGYTLDVTNGKPTRIRTRGWSEEVSLEHVHDLVMTWFDHELREQLGMEPHAPARVAAQVSTEDGDVTHAGCPLCLKASPRGVPCPCLSDPTLRSTGGA